MFAASPGLHGIEHPIYDIWLTDCKAPGETIVDAPQTADADGDAGRRSRRPTRPMPARAPTGAARHAAAQAQARCVARPAPPDDGRAPREPTQRFFPTSQYPTDLPARDPAGSSRK